MVDTCVSRCVFAAFWTRQKEQHGDHWDLLKIEAIGPAIALATWPELLRDCLWVH